MMKNLKTYFADPFDNRQIADSELLSFAEDHLDRLSAANTDGSLSAMRTATQTAFDVFAQATQREDTASNQRTGMTQTMAQAKTAFGQFVTRKEGVIRDALGGNKLTPGYLEFFPAGLSEYTRASLEQIEPLMTRFVLAAQRHTAALGNTLATDAAALQSGFVAARTGQLTKKGTVSAEKSAGKTARQALTQQLTKNLLVIASQNVGHLERVTIFFDQARLTDY
ncbi:hypothetical protein [Armatimonas sp.]|uniref:hypothetical protein n=1 Tax=Armatimonas sp. TaxID=1872638 RepID=UPI00374D789E